MRSDRTRPIVTCDQVGRSFATASGPVLALDDVDLEVPRSTLVAIAGPSGSGKSTLLAILGCLDRPTSGSVRVDEHELTLLSRRQRRRLRRSTVATLLPQPADNVLLDRSGLENVRLAAWHRGRKPADAEQVLDSLGMRSAAAQPCATMSGGEQQRIAVASALVADAVLLLADEPTGALDATNATAVIATLRQATQRTTVIVATHDPALIDAADLVVRLDHGRRLA